MTQPATEATSHSKTGDPRKEVAHLLCYSSIIIRPPLT